MPKQTTHYVHVTDIQRYQRCRRAWSWASPMRANLAPRDIYAPFFTGSLVHYGLEQLYRYNTAPEAALTALMARDYPHHAALMPNNSPLGEHYTMALGMLKHYQLWQHYRKADIYSDANTAFVALEHEYQYELWANSRARIVLRGRFDGLVLHKPTGKYYLWEIKTTRSIKQRMQQLELDTQTDAYLIAASSALSAHLGYAVEVSGVIYTLLRKKLPATPTVLNDGTLSRKKISTSPYHYTHMIAQQHPLSTTSYKADIYGEYVQELIAGEVDDPYFMRVLVTRTPAELSQAASDLTAVAREMISPKTPLYPNPTDQCGYCLFRAPCIAMQRASDVQLLLDRNYVDNERYAAERSED